MRAGLALSLLGLVLTGHGHFRSAFWYAEPGASPVRGPWGLTLLPGQGEMAAGMLLVAWGMVRLFRGGRGGPGSPPP